MKGTARSRPIFWIGIVLLVLVTVEIQARLFEILSRHLPGEPIMTRSAILQEQSRRIALMLDTTRGIRDVLDSELGWRYKVGYATPNDHMNAQGLRALHLYDSLPRPGVFRIAAFGDSFVYGNEVGDRDAWCSILESGSHDLEVLNYGVGGYGLDQAFLRFQREGMALRPDLVLIVFVPDDLRRVVSVYRRFASVLEWPLSKPRFALNADGSLREIPNPLPTRASFTRLMQHPEEVRRFGPLDAWYASTVYENPVYDHLATFRVGAAIWRWFDRRFLDPKRLIRHGMFNERSPAFAIQVALTSQFASTVRATGATPIILMVPDRGSVESVRAGGRTVYEPIREALVRRGLTVWDGIAAFRYLNGPIDQLYAPYLHYSPLGNRILARWLATQLEPVRAARNASRRAAMHIGQSSGD